MSFVSAIVVGFRLLLLLSLLFEARSFALIMSCDLTIFGSGLECINGNSVVLTDGFSVVVVVVVVVVDCCFVTAFAVSTSIGIDFDIFPSF